ncbi:hypothetical protein AYO44_03765 [Planctomycetaceae bacterium SCGC AG-212-F19]|nr:hypothetical protein AYO44_03765 [Planctomycetaceae bacterium SCGC AG-212-F19]
MAEHDPSACGLDREGSCPACQAAMDAADNGPPLGQTVLLDALRDMLRLPRRPKRLEAEAIGAAKLWLADLAVTIAADAGLAEALRGLLAAVLSGQHPLDHLFPPRVTTLHAAALAYIGTLRGEAPAPGKPCVPGLSDAELERLVRSFARKPDAARALVRVLKMAASEEKAK